MTIPLLDEVQATFVDVTNSLQNALVRVPEGLTLECAMQPSVARKALILSAEATLHRIAGRHTVQRNHLQDRVLPRKVI